MGKTVTGSGVSQCCSEQGRVSGLSAAGRPSSACKFLVGCKKNTCDTHFSYIRLKVFRLLESSRSSPCHRTRQKRTFRPAWASRLCVARPRRAFSEGRAAAGIQNGLLLRVTGPGFEFDLDFAPCPGVKATSGQDEKLRGLMSARQLCKVPVAARLPPRAAARGGTK